MNSPLLDTSVLIDLPRMAAAQTVLPDEGFVSSVSIAELMSGPLRRWPN